MTLVVDRSAEGPVERAGRLRDAAVLALSLLAPVVLVAGVLVAERLQPAGRYDPVGQTVSTLAGRGAADRWVMAVALLALGMIYLLVTAGLRAAPLVGRLVLGAGAAAVLVVALAPQPAHGSSVVHMAAMTVGAVTFTFWPLALARDPRLGRGSLVAAAVMTLALGWLCQQAWTDGTWLGVAERTLLLTQTVWPIRVAAAQTRWEWLPWRSALRKPLSRWAVITLGLALLSPAVFTVGLLAAQAAQPVPDAASWSLSALASLGATNRWIMALTLGLVGVLCVAVARGLRRLPVPPRVLFGAGGALLVVAALVPQPAGGGSSAVHLVAGGLAWAAFTLWPLVLACSSAVDVRLRRASILAFAVLLGLLAWFVAQFVTSGTWYGVSQRTVFAAQCAWPIVVAGAAVVGRRSRPSEAPEARLAEQDLNLRSEDRHM